MIVRKTVSLRHVYPNVVKTAVLAISPLMITRSKMTITKKTDDMKEEQVNHHQHYNQHRAGIECIEVIRHYSCDIANAIKCLWCAGLKLEIGKADAEKEVEDLRTALWYIADYVDNCRCQAPLSAKHDHVTYVIKRTTGYSVSQITKGYDENIAKAIRNLLYVGISNTSVNVKVYNWMEYTRAATIAIHKRIDALLPVLEEKEVPMDNTDIDTW